MASSVLTARKPTSPGTLPTAPHTSAPTTASEVFSATDSTTARAIPSASSACGSRPHRRGSRARAASTSPASRARPTARASRASEVPRRPSRWWRRSGRRRRRQTGVRPRRRGPRARRRPPRTGRCAARPTRGGPATAPVPRRRRPARKRRPDALGADRRRGGHRGGRRRRRTRSGDRHPPAQPTAGRGRIRLLNLERQPRMAICPHSGCPRPGSTRSAARVPGSRGFLPGDSGGTAPDSHRLPLLPPYWPRQSTTAPEHPSTCS